MNINSKFIFYLLLVLSFSMILIFYTLSIGVNIDITPKEIIADSKIKIIKGFGIKFGKRLIFLPGEKTVKVTSPGYYDESITFQLDNSSNVIRVDLKKLPGRVYIQIIPDIKTKIVVGDLVFADYKNNLIKLPAGDHKLIIDHPLYLKYETSISVEGLNKVQELSFELEPGWAQLTFNSQPEDADVFIDSILIGTTPLKKNVVAGKRLITFKKNGFAELNIAHKVEIGRDLIIPKVNLSLLPGKVSITSIPGNASVIIDNNFMGLTPKELSISANEQHKIQIIKQGYKDYENKIEVSSQVTKELNVTLKPIFGNVEITSFPESSIYIDGKFLSITPFSGKLSAVDHKLELVKTGYRSYSTTLKPKEALPLNISKKLLTEEEARYIESKKKYSTINKIELILFKEGEIIMGAKRSVRGQRGNEVLRNVKLTKPFYVSSHEISNGQFMAYKDKNSKGEIISRNNEPVVNISWQDAALFCNWLSNQENLKPFYTEKNGKIIGSNLNSNGYRLPTEAEWSWVARKKTTKNKNIIKFPWGNKEIVVKGSGNFSDETAKAINSSYIPNYNDGYPRLAPIKSFKSNEKGLFDLGGNVSEWVHDYYAIDFLNQALEINPTGPERGLSHVIRGSNWKTASLSQLRYAYRDNLIDYNEKTGFRVARWLAGKE